MIIKRGYFKPKQPFFFYMVFIVFYYLVWQETYPGLWSFMAPRAMVTVNPISTLNWLQPEQLHSENHNLNISFLKSGKFLNNDLTPSGLKITDHIIIPFAEFIHFGVKRFVENRL